MEWDYRKLSGKIKEVCGTQEEFSKRIGLGRVSVSKRMNNQLDFSQEEIFKSCDVLHIPKVEIPTYFFTPRV